MSDAPTKPKKERPPWHERCRTGLEKWFQVLAGYRALSLSTGLVIYFAWQFGATAQAQLAEGNVEAMSVLGELMIGAGLVYVAARLGTGVRAVGLGLYQRFSQGAGAGQPYDAGPTGSGPYGPDPDRYEG